MNSEYQTPPPPIQTLINEILKNLMSSTTFHVPYGSPSREATGPVNWT